MTNAIRCPLCGSNTNLKAAKKGPEAGRQFFVCVNYPDCKGRVAVTHKYGNERKAKNSVFKILWPTLTMIFFVVAIISVFLPWYYVEHAAGYYGNPTISYSCWDIINSSTSYISFDTDVLVAAYGAFINSILIITFALLVIIAASKTRNYKAFAILNILSMLSFILALVSCIWILVRTGMADVGYHHVEYGHYLAFAGIILGFIFLNLTIRLHVHKFLSAGGRGKWLVGRIGWQRQLPGESIAEFHARTRTSRR